MVVGPVGFCKGSILWGFLRVLYFGVPGRNIEDPTRRVCVSRLKAPYWELWLFMLTTYLYVSTSRYYKTASSFINVETYL